MPDSKKSTGSRIESNNTHTNIQSAPTEWEKLLSKISSMGLQNCRENGKMRSKQFLYWNNLIEKVFPVLQDLTSSHRGNWQLPIKYPLIYESFLDGEFVVKLSKRSASAAPMDEALE